MLKKILRTLPILAVGIVIGGLTLPNVFASANSQVIAPPAQAQQMMQQGFNTPQGQAMVQACSNFMSQFSQTQK